MPQQDKNNLLQCVLEDSYRKNRAEEVGEELNEEFKVHRGGELKPLLLQICVFAFGCSSTAILCD